MRFLGPIAVLAGLAFGSVLVHGCAPDRSSADRNPKSAPPKQDSVDFRNVSKEAGIDYSWPAEKKPLRILEAIGGGCALLDYDSDGWLDVLLVTRPHVRLWRNRNGRFTDVTRETGLDGVDGYWRGCAVGDYNADGHPDLLLTGLPAPGSA
jgi:hypothetical protein